MALETGTYIDSLNAANPEATDGVALGDDHIRLVKSTILATFPGLTGAVTSTQVEINYLDGVTGTTGTGDLALSDGPTFTGTVTADAFTGSIAAANIDSGTLADARVAETNVTQHEAALTITESQIMGFGNYLPAVGGTATSINMASTDTTLTRLGPGQLGVEGDAVLSHNSGAYSSGKVHFSNGTEPTTEGDNGDIFLVY